MSDNPTTPPSRRNPLDGPSGQLGQARTRQLPGLLPSAGTVHGAVTNPLRAARGALEDQAKAAAIRRIAAYFNIDSEHLTEGIDLAGLTMSALSGSFLSLGKLHMIMLSSGIQAMEAGLRIDDNLCAAHTFGFWVGEHLGAHEPRRPPRRRRSFHETEDERGNHDHRTTLEWERRWLHVHRRTIAALNQSLEIRAVRNTLMQRMPGINPRSEYSPHRMPEQDARIMMRRFIAVDFNNDPAAAAAVFFADRIKTEDDVPRRVSVLTYRRNAYVP